MVSFRRSPGSEHGVGVMLDVGCSRITSWSYFYRPCFAFSSRSHLRMLATIYASRLLQLHLIPFTLPISLNSLDREGVRLLSPRDSQIVPKPACRCRWDRADDATKLRRSSMKILSFVLFRSSWSVVEPSWGRSGTLSHLGFFFYFGSVVGPWLYLFDVMLYSCIVWSGDCKPTLYPFLIQYMGLCEDYPTCD